MTTPSQVRVRFAPSPTGFLHVGGARTALFNYLYAKHHKGVFVLRIEDTDEDRSTEESVGQILDSMKWLGLHWDEGPFYQKEFAPRHRAVAAKLIEEGKAYYDFASEESIEAARKSAMRARQAFIYRGKDRDLPLAEAKARVAAGERACVRFKTPIEGQVTFDDGLAGPITFDHNVIGDFVLLRPDTMPVYNFACALDDVEMRITHVIRGADHISNTPRQLLVMDAIGAQRPKYMHLPLIMKEGKKMSKRDAESDQSFPVSVHARRDLGYLPEATVNFLSLLGWSYEAEKELFTIEQAIAKFDGTGCNSAAANFDEDKFTWMNGWYIRNLPAEDITKRATAAMKHAGLPVDGRDPAWLQSVIALEIERSKYLRDFAANLEYFFVAPKAFPEKAAKDFFLGAGGADRLREIADAIAALPTFDKTSMEAGLRALSEKRGEHFKNIAQPVRTALTGRTASPGLFEVMELLGKEECVARVRAVVSALEAGTLATIAPPPRPAGGEAKAPAPAPKAT